MSVTLQPTSLRIPQTRQESSTPVGQPSVQGTTPTPESAQGLTVADGFEVASARQQEWAAKFGANAGLQQTQDNNCGAAAAVIVSNSMGGPKGAPDSLKMDALDSRFADDKGTTPHQISNMLAHEGLAVKQAAFKFDQHALDETLSKGGKIVAMVDSDQILPGGDAQATGRAHWVVIDGKDDQGRFTVKDPGNGSSYTVDFNKLSGAVDSGWFKHNGGGMLLVEDAPASMSEATLAQENAKQIVTLANTPGGGSRAASTFGRESS